MPLFPEPTPQNIYFGTHALISLSTAWAHLAHPATSLKTFSGANAKTPPSPTSLVLTQLLASGEALTSYLCIEALLSDSVEMRALVVRAVGVYTMLHMGTFWYGHRRYNVARGKGVGTFVAGLVMSGVACVWWGVVWREGAAGAAPLGAASVSA